MFTRVLTMDKSKRPTWMLPPVADLTEFPLLGVARQLGAITRYCGATPDHYSVARHSLVVASLLPNVRELRLLALLHDVHECWTNDLPRPVFEVIGTRLKEYQSELDVMLFRLAGIAPTDEEIKIVSGADSFACDLEMRFLGSPDSYIYESLPSYPTAAQLLCARGNGTMDAMIWGNRTMDAMIWRLAVEHWRDGVTEHVDSQFVQVLHCVGKEHSEGEHQERQA